MCIGGYTECDINWGLKATSKRINKAIGHIGLLRGNELEKSSCFDFEEFS